MNTYLQQIKAMAKEVKGNKLITDVKFSTNKPVSKLHLDMFNSQKVTLSEEILSFYKELNGFHLSWKMKADYEKVLSAELPFIGGEINILGLAETFVFSSENKIWFKGKDSDDLLTRRYNEFSQNLLMFDTTPEIFSNTQMAVIFLDKAKNRNKTVEEMPVWFWNTKGIKFRLSLDFAAYISRLLETRGMFFWQTFFLDFEATDFADPLTREKLIPYLNAEIPKMQAFLDYMPRLFPQIELKFYTDAYEKFKAKMTALNYTF